MAEKIKNSRTFFIVGLLIGLLIGIYVSFSQRHKKPIDYFEPISLLDEKAKEASKNKLKYNPKKKKKPSDPIESINGDSTKIMNDSLLAINEINSDSLSSDSIAHNNQQASKIANTDLNTEDSITDQPMIENLDYRPLNIKSSRSNDIHIAKNELIYAIYVIPQGSKNDFLCRTRDSRDSILTNNMGAKTDEGMYVEFWRSPVNYSGYKLSNNTLVLFGIYEYTQIRLQYMSTGLLRLKYHEKIYDLKCTEEFNALILPKNKKGTK